jgi:hypothetical protein
MTEVRELQKCRVQRAWRKGESGSISVIRMFFILLFKKNKGTNEVNPTNHQQSFPFSEARSIITHIEMKSIHQISNNHSPLSEGEGARG